MTAKEDSDKVGFECVSDQEREYAQSALAEFNQKNYSACLQHISKLDSRTHDFKVLHNKHVTEYYKSDLRKSEQFQKHFNALFAQFHLHVDKLDYVDHCVAYYNQAVILYHQRQYAAAVVIMDRVYKFIEPMDEILGRQVGLLLVELYICVRQIDKATNLITYLHNHALNQVTPSLLNTTKVPVKNKQIEKDKKPAQPVTKATERFLKVLDRYRIRCNLLTHSIKAAKSDIQLLHQADKENVQVLFLMANQEYLQGNFNTAIKLLTTIPNDSLTTSEHGESSTVLFYNNMGVIHHAMGKPNLACHYYQQALKEEMEVAKKTGEGPLHTLGASKYHELMYNLGISLLYAGKAAHAFDCLIIAVRRYHRNSRLWLRLAECCIKVHKDCNDSDFDISRKKDIVVELIGSSEAQKVILTTNITNDKKFSSESQSYAVPVATQEFASLCLRNAKTLLPSDMAASPVPLLLIPGVTPPAQSNNPGPAPSALLDPDEIATLRNAILASSAYVALCLGDYILALEHSKELLAQPKISGVHRLLSHLYAAECLVLLDKLSEALEHLNPENIKDISFNILEEPIDDIEVQTKPPIKWFPNNLASALSVMQYNVAVVKTLRGQLDQAAALLKQIWTKRNNECKVPVHIIMLVLYIELQLGHTEAARKLIKQYSLNQRFNGNLMWALQKKHRL